VVTQDVVLWAWKHALCVGGDAYLVGCVPAGRSSKDDTPSTGFRGPAVSMSDPAVTTPGAVKMCCTALVKASTRKICYIVAFANTGVLEARKSTVTAANIYYFANMVRVTPLFFLIEVFGEFWQKLLEKQRGNSEKIHTLKQSWRNVGKADTNAKICRRVQFSHF